MGPAQNILGSWGVCPNAPQNRLRRHMLVPTNVTESVLCLSSCGVISRTSLSGSALAGWVTSRNAGQSQISQLLRHNCRNCRPSRQNRSVERTQPAPDYLTTLPALRWPPTRHCYALSPLFELGREAPGTIDMSRPTNRNSQGNR